VATLRAQPRKVVGGVLRVRFLDGGRRLAILRLANAAQLIVMCPA
jgi:hypothetical protein